MDSTGWHARRRAEKENRAYAHVHPGQGHYQTGEVIGPLPEQFIGGFQPHQHAHGIPSPPLAKHEGHTHEQHFRLGGRDGRSPSGHSFQGVPVGTQEEDRRDDGDLVGQPAQGGAKFDTQAPPPLALPKDGLPQDQEQDQTVPFPGLPMSGKMPIPHATEFDGIPAPLPPEPKDDPDGTNTSTTYNPTQSSMVSTKQLTAMSAIDRSRILRVARMDPHLQFMCGPLLKFDTIDEDGVWHGAAMIVTADAGSAYEPYPTLTYEWDVDRALPNTFSKFKSSPQAAASRSTVTLSKLNSPIDGKKSRRFSLSRKTHKQQQKANTRNGTNGTENGGGQLLSPNAVGDYTTPSDTASMAWNQLHGVPSFDLGPHPADPHSTIMPASPINGIPLFPAPSRTSVSTERSNTTSSSPHSSSPLQNAVPIISVPVPPVSAFPLGGPGGYGILNNGPNSHKETVVGQELYVYGGSGGTFTFWRFKLKVPLGDREMGVRYSINKGQNMEFYVPSRTAGMRLAVHSCNGFSAGVNPDDFRGPGFKSGYDPVWMDLLSKHAETPFHALVGGGDQLYCDSLMREPEMQEWVARMKPEEKKAFPLTEEISLAIERFFFNHYCQHFRSGAFARANSSIPMLNMCDDHDLIDGFGSYPDDLQMAPVFRAVGSRGYFYFLLFQCFINPEVDGFSDVPGGHFYISLVIGPENGPFIPYPSHSSLSRMGPKEWILMLDCRAERKKEQVCSPGEYAKVFERLHKLPEGVDHLIVQLGIPIAYPRMVFLESALDSKFNPLVALGKNGTMGLGGFVNKFNAEAELLDDLNDHWTARGHKKERNWFIEQLQNFAHAKRIRVTFVSGDVHCASVGVLKTLKHKGKSEIPPEEDYRYMQNVVTSAIVNTPPPNGVITMVSSLATKVHKTLHGINTDETMLPIFTHEPQGEPRKQKFIMGRRNWCRVERDDAGSMVFDLRVEREKGYGATVGYSTSVPPPRWVAKVE
ncbi:plasma membrane protein [Coprinopsis marcescibilis]|uniref:Plasma membrane protein n=1 Tax=Coprinopsis marcescibilis TaxID=230819 RepID=A0A5C3L493_COPMA|nr:plasma membrane protein [Coprinopsis marcescibilis]